LPPDATGSIRLALIVLFTGEVQLPIFYNEVAIEFRFNLVPDIRIAGIKKSMISLDTLAIGRELVFFPASYFFTPGSLQQG
jgi:hypothetical protein